MLFRSAKLVIEPIFEADFLPCSYGFRPKRSATQALEAIRKAGNRGYDFVVDFDIRSYFDNIDRDWLVKFIEHRIGDRRIVRLIIKWLKAGIIEGTVWKDEGKGTPQGSVLSPLLANVFLHYVFDLWVHQWRQRHAQGDMIVVRYADDFVIGFEQIGRAHV